jgi:hypothetical protein
MSKFVICVRSYIVSFVHNLSRCKILMRSIDTGVKQCDDLIFARSLRHGGARRQARDDSVHARADGKSRANAGHRWIPASIQNLLNVKGSDDLI